eukprot:4135586-Amphidinium_carterae.1
MPGTDNIILGLAKDPAAHCNENAIQGIRAKVFPRDVLQFTWSWSQYWCHWLIWPALLKFTPCTSSEGAPRALVVSEGIPRGFAAMTLTMVSMGIANLEMAIMGRQGELHQFIKSNLWGKSERFELTPSNTALIRKALSRGSQSHDWTGCHFLDVRILRNPE